MKLARLAVFLALPLMAASLCAQSAPASIQNLYAAGVSYSVNASPAVAGTGLYAHLMADTGTYAFTAIDATPATLKPFTVTSNVGIGIAQKVMTLGKVDVFVPTSAGISWSGANTGWQWSGGALAAIPLKNGTYLMPTVRFLKSSVSGGSGYQPIVGILFGWGEVALSDKTYPCPDPVTLAEKIKAAGGPQLDPTQPFGHASADGVTLSWSIQNGEINIRIESKPFFISTGVIWSHVDALFA